MNTRYFKEINCYITSKDFNEKSCLVLKQKVKFAELRYQDVEKEETEMPNIKLKRLTLHSNFDTWKGTNVLQQPFYLTTRSLKFYKIYYGFGHVNISYRIQVGKPLLYER